ncbi:MAG: iron complex transport system ATP-binding protein [Miltoncostaeaceae bacterium]|nr:iron complex transport system ATP-binding protein [Miltoncostaeaceae bacterium]
MPDPTPPSAAIETRGVGVWLPVDGTRKQLLEDVTWRVGAGEHWVLLGPNGAGKTTLLRVAGARRHPSEGEAWVMGRRIGATDVRDLWTVVGAVDAGAANRFPERLTAGEVVLTGARGVIAPLRPRYTGAELARADELMALVGVAGHAGQRFSTCSTGERQRVLIARALMPDPALLLLDEPSGGLDLPAREALLRAVDELAGAHPRLATVTVTHHVEEIPAAATHALLLADGRVSAQGPIGETLTGEALSRCFGLPIALTRHGGRYAARADGAA